MSIKKMTQVWEADIQPASRKLTLLALADWSNDEGVCWPSRAAIAKRVGVGDRQTTALIADLIRAGYITVEERHGGTNVYRIHLPADRPAAIPLAPQPAPQPAPAPAQQPDLSDPDAYFEALQIWLETNIGYPVKPEPRQIDAMKEMMTLRVTEPDIAEAVSFFASIGRVVYRPSDILNSVRRAVMSRTQAKARKPGTGKQYTPPPQYTAAEQQAAEAARLRKMLEQ